MNLIELQSMKRPALQALCKENDLKANSKTETLLESLIKHFKLNQEKEELIPISNKQQIKKSVNSNNNIQSSTSKPSTTKSTTKKVFPTSAIKERSNIERSNRELEEDASEDEMMLGSIAPKKVKSSSKGKEVVHNDSVSTVIRNGPESSFSMIQAGSTSPGTKLKIETLCKVIETLQADLTTTKAAHSNLFNLVNSLPPPPPPIASKSPQSPKVSKSEIVNLIDQKYQAFKQELKKEFDSKFENFSLALENQNSSTSNKVTEINQSVESIQADILEFKSSMEAAVDNVRTEFISKLTASTIFQSTQSTQSQPIPLSIPFTSPNFKSNPRLSEIYNSMNPFISNASPSLSDVAPPIQSLNSFSSPSQSVNNDEEIAIDRSMMNAIPSVSSNIFKSPTKVMSTTTNSNFKSEVINSIVRSSGKHPRYSEESSFSTDSPTVANGDRRDLTMGQAPMKRARMSEVAVVAVEDEEEEEEEDEDCNEEVDQAEDSFVSEESSFNSSIIVGQQSNHRDTIVSTKSGDEVVTIPVSISDPSYFSAPSPSHSIKAPTSIKASPFKSRKSLPMSNLPFPINSDSPYGVSTKAKMTSSSNSTPFGDSSNFNNFSAPGSSKFSYITAATPVASKTLFGTEDSRFGDVPQTTGRNVSPAKVWNASKKAPWM